MIIYIDIEGTDGCGKQTQSKLLLEALQQKGIKSIMQSFPSYDSKSSGPVKMYLAGEFGESANSLNAYQASALFAVDRLCTMKLLEKEMKDGVVVFDRYTPSNMIHQASKIDDIEEKNKYLKWVEEFEYDVLKLPRPTLTIFLDMPVEKSVEMANNRTELKNQEKKDIHENLEHLSLAYNNSKYVSDLFGWTIINCVDENNNIKSIPEIHEDIMKVINKLLEDNQI